MKNNQTTTTTHQANTSPIETPTKPKAVWGYTVQHFKSPMPAGVYDPKAMIRMARYFIIDKSEKHVVALFQDRANQTFSYAALRMEDIEHRELYAEYLCWFLRLACAASLTVVYNHPQGDLTINDEHYSLIAAFNRTGVTLNDMIVYSDNGYVSVTEHLQSFSEST